MLGVAIRNRDFRLLWGSHLVSQLGNWFSRVPVLAMIGDLGGSMGGVGALYAAELALRLLPTAVFSSLAGPIADRVPRRLLMVLTDILQALTVLGLLLVKTPSDLPLLYGLIVAQMSLSIFFHAASSASVPNVVKREELHEANALMAVTWSAMLCLGAVAGGWFANVFGVPTAIVLDAATFLVSALMVGRLVLPPVPEHETPFALRDMLLFREMRRGLAHVRELGILPELMAKVFWGPAGGFLVLLSLAANERFGPLREAHYADDPEAAVKAVAYATGWLYSARGIGTGLGPILARFLSGSSDRALRWQIATGFFVAALFYAGFALAQELWLAFLFVALAHMGGSTIWVASTVFWQRKVHDAFRGRVYALEFAGMTLAFTGGGAVAGLLFDRGGSLFGLGPDAALRLATWTTCALVLLNGVLWILFARGGRRKAAAPPTD